MMLACTGPPTSPRSGLILAHGEMVYSWSRASVKAKRHRTPMPVRMYQPQISSTHGFVAIAFILAARRLMSIPEPTSCDQRIVVGPTQIRYALSIRLASVAFAQRITCICSSCPRQRCSPRVQLGELRARRLGCVFGCPNRRGGVAG